MESKFTFKYHDGDKRWSNVSVAGTFNDWSPETTLLTYDTLSSCWTRDVKLSVSPLSKIMYKYVLDGAKWVCDDTETEEDVNGNVNNVAFTQPILQKSVDDNQHVETALDEDEPLDVTIDDDCIRSSPNSSSTTLSNIPEMEIKEQPNNDKANLNDDKRINSTVDVKIKNIDENEQNMTFWEYIKWIFEFYIFSLFSSNKDNN